MQKKFVNLQRRMTELAVALAAIPKKARCSRFARRLGSSTTRMSFVSVMCIAVGAAVSAQVPRVHKVDACKLLLEAARSTPIIDLNTKYLSQGSTWLSCEYTDVGPGQNLLDAQWRVGFGFVPNRSIAEAEKNWQAVYDKWKGQKSESPNVTVSVTRLRSYGADDAFVVEAVRQDPSPGSREAMVYWRKGVYEGTLQLRAPLSSHMADIEDVEALLKAINWAAFVK